MKSRPASAPSGDCRVISRGIGCSIYSSFAAIGFSALSRSRRSTSAPSASRSAYCSLASSVTLVVMRQRRKFVADPDQARRIMRGIAVELELEITRAGVFVCVGNAALAFDLVVHADRVPDRDALQPPAARQGSARYPSSPRSRDSRASIPAIFAGHAVEEIGAEPAQQRIQDRLVDLGRPKAGRERRDILFRAGLDLRGDAGGVHARTRCRSRIAPDKARARSQARGAIRRWSVAAKDARACRTISRPAFRRWRRSTVPLPSISISARTNTCTDDVITTLPNRNGFANGIGRSKNEISRTAMTRRHGVLHSSPARFG